MNQLGNSGPSGETQPRPPLRPLDLPTRIVGDYHGAHHWKTEVVATSVEMLSGRRKRDYEADSLAAQAAGDSTAIATTEASDSDEADEADETDGETPVEDEQVLVLA